MVEAKTTRDGFKHATSEATGMSVARSQIFKHLIQHGHETNMTNINAIILMYSNYNH